MTRIPTALSIMQSLRNYSSYFLLFVILITSIGIVYSLQTSSASMSYASLPALLIERPPIWPPTSNSATTPEAPTTTPSESPPLYLYVEVLDGCGPNHQGECVNMRAGPGVTYPSIGKLRTGVVLRVEKTVIEDGREWFMIKKDNDVRFPERIEGDWYVASEFVHPFLDDGDHTLKRGEVSTSTKRIVVDRSEQMLYAYDTDTLYMKTPISSGLALTPTPRGTFTVFKMTPSRYMQGPLLGVSDQVYDLPGVPWNLYFTHEGAVIHGAYWHDKFGIAWSHGCVNLPLAEAKKLYLWAEIGTTVTVRE